MFNNRILRILTQKCSPCKNSRQITAIAKIHGKRQNSRLPWIHDFRLALNITLVIMDIIYSLPASKCPAYNELYSGKAGQCTAVSHSVSIDEHN